MQSSNWPPTISISSVNVVDWSSSCGWFAGMTSSPLSTRYESQLSRVGAS